MKYHAETADGRPLTRFEADTFARLARGLERLEAEGKVPTADVDEEGRVGPEFIEALALAIAAEDAERIERKPQSLDEWAALAATPARGAQRRKAIARLTGKLLSHGVDPALVLEQMQGHNTARCVPPLEIAEVERIVEWCCARHADRLEGK